MSSPETVLTEFAVDPSLMTLFKDCMDNFGCGGPGAEWGNNVISTRFVIYGDGMISKQNTPTSHRVSSQELELCKSVSHQLAARCKQQVGMGTEQLGSEPKDFFRPFYITAQLGTADNPAVVPTEITKELIISKFADTIFPFASTVVEALSANGEWWKAVEEDGSGEQNYLRPWHDMIKAFREHPALNAPVFVQIGEYDGHDWTEEEGCPVGFEMEGSVLPRMALALTARGSIVGLFGQVTHT